MHVGIRESPDAVLGTVDVREKLPERQIWGENALQGKGLIAREIVVQRVHLVVLNEPPDCEPVLGVVVLSAK